MNEKIENLLPKQGAAYLHEGLFSVDESAKYMEELMTGIRWKQEPIVIFGKQVMQPRLTAWHGDSGKSYRYSGILMEPTPWNKTLLEIKAKIEKITGVTFNSALLNQYRHEKDSMGWHRDNEKELGMNPVIASVSFGEVRRFLFRHYLEKSLKKELYLNSGSLLMMSGETQKHWEHSISKQSTPVGPRINITFRTILS